MRGRQAVKRLVRHATCQKRVGVALGRCRTAGQHGEGGEQGTNAKGAHRSLQYGIPTPTRFLPRSFRGAPSPCRVCFFELEIPQRNDVARWIAFRVDQQRRGLGVGGRTLDHCAARDRNALTVSHLRRQQLLKGLRVRADALQFGDLHVRITAEACNLGFEEYLRGGNENNENPMHVFTRGWPQAMTDEARDGRRAQSTPPGHTPGGEYLNAFRSKKDLATVQSSRLALTWCLIQSMMRSAILRLLWSCMNM